MYAGQQRARQSFNSGENITFEADLSSLKPFPGNLGCFEVYEYIVDKWSTISMKNVHYSVPDSLVGEKVHVKVYSEKKSSSCTGRRKWPLINAVIVVETGASSWSTICVHFPVNRGIAPLCGLAKSTGRTEKAV